MRLIIVLSGFQSSMYLILTGAKIQQMYQLPKSFVPGTKARNDEVTDSPPAKTPN
jgi:hypothetical protein